ncbi:hypothetical protein BV20DRAFT_1058590 [Pilatotrama ljubarskyi]|nr:hypothetical protein BV20DRAFT_1058590 [Pilatotrama ljubarskyi]
MHIALRRPHYEVLASILKIHRGARREIRWNRFEDALCAVGFVASSKGAGSKYTFISKGPLVRAPFSVQKPKDNVLTKRDQDGLKVLFLARYGWRRASFICEP